MTLALVFALYFVFSIGVIFHLALQVTVLEKNSEILERDINYYREAFYKRSVPFIAKPVTETPNLFAPRAHVDPTKAETL